MRNRVSAILILAILLGGVVVIGSWQIPLIGRIFDNYKEIPEFAVFEGMSAAIVDVDKPGQEYKYAVMYLRNSERGLLVFEQIIRRDSSGNVWYKILDTCNINRIEPDEDVVLVGCHDFGIRDTEIAVMVKADYSKEYFEHILRAWRTDRKTGKIVPLQNLRGLKCINDGFGI